MRVEPLDGKADAPRRGRRPALPRRRDGRDGVPDPRRRARPASPRRSSSARPGSNVVLVDDKAALGGKLVLQTHKFFGSIEACHAGTRGMDIGTKLEAEVRSFPSVRLWPETTALAVFSDRKVGVLRRVTTSSSARRSSSWRPGPARSRSSSRATPCPASTARARSRPSSTATSCAPPSGSSSSAAATSASSPATTRSRPGSRWSGSARRSPTAAATRCTRTSSCGWACPIHTRHTVVSANGKRGGRERHHRPARPAWKAVPGTEKTFACDTLLVAVGLDPVDEFLRKAKEFGLPVLAAGDAEEIAEASAAMFTGKIRGTEIARMLGRDVGEVPAGVAPHRRGPEGPARRRHHRGDPRARGGRLPDLPLLPGDPLQPLHLDLPQARDHDRGGRHPRPARPSTRAPASPASSAWRSAPAWPSRSSTTGRRTPDGVARHHPLRVHRRRRSRKGTR